MASPDHRHANTVALIRQLRAAGRPVAPRRRVGRILPPTKPAAIQREYFAAMRPICTLAADCFAHEIPEILRLLRSLRRHQGHQDAGNAGIGAGRAAQLGAAAAAKDKRKEAQRAGEIGADLAHAQDEGRKARALVDRAAARFAQELRPQALHDVARKFGERTSDFQRAQLDQQLRGAIGIPFSAIDRSSRDKIDEFAARNVDLIKTVPERYFDRLRGDVMEAFEGGMHPDTLADTFVERDGMSQDDADRIARDQIGKLSAELNQDRLESIGVTRYTWRGSQDNRERDSHLELEGQVFEFDDPPMGGGTNEDEPGNPGDGILCRCYAEPVLDDVIEGLSAS